LARAMLGEVDVHLPLDAVAHEGLATRRRQVGALATRVRLERRQTGRPGVLLERGFGTGHGEDGERSDTAEHGGPPSGLSPYPEVAPVVAPGVPPTPSTRPGAPPSSRARTAAARTRAPRRATPRHARSRSA